MKLTTSWRLVSRSRGWRLRWYSVAMWVGAFGTAVVPWISGISSIAWQPIVGVCGLALVGAGECLNHPRRALIQAGFGLARVRSRRNTVAGLVALGVGSGLITAAAVGSLL